MFELQLYMKKSKFLRSDLNAVDVALVSMIVLFMINFKMRVPDLTEGLPTEMTAS